MKFGLGEYSDEPFTLKSGNTPLYKGLGSSPYDSTEDESTEDESKKGMSVGAKIGQTLISGITSGLDAVYGTGKIAFKDGKKVAENKEKTDEETKSLQERMAAIEESMKTKTA